MIPRWLWDGSKMAVMAGRQTDKTARHPAKAGQRAVRGLNNIRRSVGQGIGGSQQPSAAPPSKNQTKRAAIGCPPKNQTKQAAVRFPPKSRAGRKSNGQTVRTSGRHPIIGVSDRQMEISCAMSYIALSNGFFMASASSMSKSTMPPF